MDHTVRVWDLANGTSRIFVGHGDMVSRVAFAARGDAVISTSNDSTTRVWNLATGAIRVLPYGSGFPAFAVSPDGGTLCFFDQLSDLSSGEGRRLTPYDWVRTIPPSRHVAD